MQYDIVDIQIDLNKKGEVAVKYLIHIDNLK